MNIVTHYPITISALMLAASNVFMTFAWYGHLKHLNGKPWWIAALISWGIALFEYLIQVPENRLGFEHMNLATENTAEGNHARRIRAVCRVLHGTGDQAELSVCGGVLDGGGVFHI